MAIGVSRVFHLNVNCSNLERSLNFYRDLLGLQTVVRTTPAEPQPGGAFGLESTQWDAWILADSRGLDGVAIDLLEWQVPPPTGKPYAKANELGFARIGITTTDIDAAYERLIDAGVDCYGAPHDVGVEGVPAMKAFVCEDPDGTLIELMSGPTDRVGVAIVNVSDFERSIDFYERVLGFKTLARFGSGERDGEGLRLGPKVDWEMAYLDDPRGEFAFAVDLVHWNTPKAKGTPYDSANHLGIYRMAFQTDDIDAAYGALRAEGITCVSPPATLSMGPGIPDLRALLFPDPDGTMLELIEVPS
ncbi:MAG: VOC family protein [Actinobacteria bacterium]|nr:VOC family protein [Actinomycetota bacterium]